MIRPFVGGSFGSKFEMFSLDFCAALLAIKTGRPVKIVLSREEVFTTTRTRHPMAMDLKTGVKSDGTLVFYDCKLIADTGAYYSTGPVAIYFSGSLLAATYKVPNIRYEGYAVYTNKPTSGALRGHGGLQPRYLCDTQFDRIAEELGIDPLEIRLKNAPEHGYIAPNGFVITT